MGTSLQDIYDGFADTYEENRGLFDMTPVLDSFFGRLNLKRGRALDLGCGAGEPFGRFFVDRNWDVTGVDFSERMLQLAAKYVPEMNTIHADMRQIEFEADQFNAITAIYSLFHVPASDHPALLQKFHRWLQPGGKVLFTYATRDFTGQEEFDGRLEFMGQALYYSHKCPEALIADLKQVGFSIDAAEYRDIGDEVFLWITAGKPQR